RVAIDSSGPLPDATQTTAALVGYLAASYDAVAGTLGPPPLFPRAPVLEFLLDAGGNRDARGENEAGGEHEARGDNVRREPEQTVAHQMAALVVEKLGSSPLHDAAGEGFFRYARQAAWQDPADGKLLADNAALASA